MNANDLDMWRRGDKFAATHLNQAVQYLKDRGDTSVGSGLRVYTGSGGTSISLNSSDFTGRWFIGKISASGPSGEADFADEHYYVICEYMSPTGDVTTSIDFKDEKSLFGEPKDPGADPDADVITDYNNIALAVNIAECKNKTHNLTYGEYVYVWETRELGSLPDDSGSSDQTAPKDAMFRWVFFSPDPGRGQYAGMTLVTQTQNNRGWVFPFCHAALT